MKLPKYKKKWRKEFSIDSGIEGDALYLKSIQNSNMNSICTINNTLKIYQGILPIDKNKTFFFELFKYLTKYYIFKQESFMTGIRAKRVGLSEKDCEELIKTHLITKFSLTILKSLKTSPGEKFVLLKLYTDLINNTLGLVNDGHKFELVIQKKIGYKYYKNIIYY